MRFKRSKFIVVEIGKASSIQLEAFLAGTLEFNSRDVLTVFSPISRAKHAVEIEDLEIVLSFSEDEWRPAPNDAVGSKAVALANKGLLISDSEGASDLRQREEGLRQLQWHPRAASYHFATHLEEGGPASSLVDMEAMEKNASKNAGRFVDRHGAPPPAFRHHEGQPFDLPTVDKDNDLYRALVQRRTTRAFDDRPIGVEKLSVLLRYVFGYHGIYQPIDELSILHKTSPSGGGLHPIEVYPLILRGDKLATGLYHYDVERHRLVELSQLPLVEAEEFSTKACRGQAYVAGASVLFFMVARWGRNFWKYRESARTYSIILKDAGHLSQSFYLVAEDLGLGAFYTGAICAEPIAEALGVDILEEGPLGVCGCGFRRPDGRALAPAFETLDRS